MDEVFSSPLQMPMPSPKPRGGMFGGGGKFGWKEALAAGLAGFVSRRNPAPLQALLQMQMQKQQDQGREQEYQRHREDGFNDWQRKQQWEMEHPQAPQPTEFERIVQAGGFQPGTPEFTDLMRRKAEAAANPIVMTPYGPMPYSAVNGGVQQAPAKPLTDEDILRMQGGPTPQASGGFPRPY